MENKRFLYDLHDGCFRDNGKAISTKQVLTLLNGLSEEKNQLIHKLSQQEMEYATACHRLSEENEKLNRELHSALNLLENNGLI